MNEKQKKLIGISESNLPTDEELMANISKYNLFDSKELTPQGIFPAKFLCMKLPDGGWEGADNAFFYFHFRIGMHDVIAGFLGSRKLSENSLSFHLFRILTGIRPSGYVTPESMAAYRGVRAKIVVIPSEAKRQRKFYPRITAVYPINVEVQTHARR
ncbi:MAG: hypothetical protein V1492_04010 [Candidatus Micrarchaeota archaeon]